MRSRRSSRPTVRLLALAVLATAAELYAAHAQFERELTRLEASVGARVEATAQALSQQLASAVPTPTPAPTFAQSPREALTRALAATLELMRNPDDGLMPDLLRVAEDGFVAAHRREFEHLKKNGLRLSPRSGFQIVRLEQLQSGPDEASFLTEEEWVYEEQRGGDVVRCLVEVSTQRYQVRQRADRWVVASVSLSTTPLRQSCAERNLSQSVAGLR